MRDGRVVASPRRPAASRSRDTPYGAGRCLVRRQPVAAAAPAGAGRSGAGPRPAGLAYDGGGAGSGTGRRLAAVLRRSAPRDRPPRRDRRPPRRACAAASSTPCIERLPSLPAEQAENGGRGLRPGPRAEARRAGAERHRRECDRGARARGARSALRAGLAGRGGDRRNARDRRRSDVGVGPDRPAGGARRRGAAGRLQERRPRPRSRPAAHPRPTRRSSRSTGSSFSRSTPGGGSGRSLSGPPDPRSRSCAPKTSTGRSTSSRPRDRMAALP